MLPRLMCNILPSGIMGRRKLSTIVIFTMLVPLFITMITVSQAATVEGVSFNSDSITITPNDPVAGTPISIKLTLNNSNTETTEVDVYYYKNSYESASPTPNSVNRSIQPLLAPDLSP